MLPPPPRRLLIAAVLAAAVLGAAAPATAGTSGAPRAASASAAAALAAQSLARASTLAGQALAHIQAGEMAASAAPAAQPTGVDPGQDGSVNYPAYDSGYHNYPEMVAHIHDVQTAHPGIVKVFSIGQSYQGRDLWAAEVNSDVTSTAKMPEVFFDGLHHAREHLSAEMAIHVLDLLADNYGGTDSLGTRVTHILDTRRIWIVFMVNPDGLQYDISGPSNDPYMAWRKNRQPNPGSSFKGTDINRNYGYDWGCCGGSSSSPASETYRGPAAWSTPEARAIRDFVLSRVIDGVQQIRTHITFHTAGKLVLWPYGYTYANVPTDMTVQDHKAFVALGDHMAASNGYTPQQSSDLYTTDGDQIDWMYGAERIFSFTFEMYPGPNDVYSGQRWYPPDEKIGALTQVNDDAVLYLMEQADCPWRASGKAAAYCGPFYDDLEIARDWQRNPAGTDTATAGTWMRATATPKPYQLGAWDGRSELVTGPKGADVDGGRTTVRSRLIDLPNRAARLQLHYWVGLDKRATSTDGLSIQLVDAAGHRVATALTVRGDGTSHTPTWKQLVFDIPAGLRGTQVAIQLVAVDAGADATVEAGVDSLRITAP